MILYGRMDGREGLLDRFIGYLIDFGWRHD